ncbi:MAG: PaaI family thioesterase [Balneolales bacterium]
MEPAKKSVSGNIEQIHSRCIACGSENEDGLHLRFEKIEEERLTAKFQCNDGYQGYSGILHGGIVSLILDSAMCNCVFAQGKAALTAEMNVRFHHPVLTEREAWVSAIIKRSSHSLYFLEAEIVQDNEIKASATAKLLDQSESLTGFDRGYIKK